MLFFTRPSGAVRFLSSLSLPFLFSIVLTMPHDNLTIDSLPAPLPDKTPNCNVFDGKTTSEVTNRKKSEGLTSLYL